MNVQLCYELRNEPGHYKVRKRVMTVEEAKKIFQEELTDNQIYGKVWLRYFDGWHYRTQKVLKER